MFTTEEILEDLADSTTPVRELPAGYVVKHPARTAKATTDWIRRNPERRREHQRRYYLKNRARLLEAQRIRDAARRMK